MRGSPTQKVTMLSTLTPEQLVPADHPIRRIKVIVEGAARSGKCEPVRPCWAPSRLLQGGPPLGGGTNEDSAPMPLALRVLTGETDEPDRPGLHCDRCQILGERLEAQAEEVRRLVQAIETVVSRVSTAEPGIGDEPLLPVAPIGAESVLAGSPSSLPRGRREVEVLRLMAHGATNDRIAWKLGISPGTVKTHVKNILRKLDASNRAEAVYRLVSAGNPSF